jgi:AcrR family transcriptional regulator
VSKSDTKKRILDAAEELFAEASFDAVPVREIMRRANARLGLMNYYFETKEALLEAVIARRINVLNSARREALNSFAGTSDSSLERLVDALVDPYLAMMLAEDTGWRYYGRLVAMLAQSSRWNDIVHRYFDETAEMFLAELRRLYPAVDHSTAVRAFVFSVAAMVNLFSMSGRMRSLSEGAIDEEKVNESVEALKTFMVSGLEGIVRSSEKRKSRTS